MNERQRRQAALFSAARTIMERDIIPHCSVCKVPCCTLQKVVLDLDWPEVQRLYQITSSKKAYDRAIDRGDVPHMKRGTDHNGEHYWAHQAPCPAYDEAGHRCRVYGTPTKPRGCSDFPIYKDGDAVTIDLRCEAVDADRVERELADAAGPIRRGIAAYDVILSFELAAPPKKPK